MITVSEQHARRVAAAVQATAAQAPWAADFLARGRGEGDDREPFVIAPVTRASTITRDAVILSPGYGRTPHGRVVHHFGALSDPDGERMLTVALTRARTRMHLVSALRAEDLEEDRLDGGARAFHGLLGLLLSETDAGRPGRLSDPLLTDLRDRLEDHGAHTSPHHGGVMDLAVADARGPRGRARPLALVSDGGEAYRELSVRERSRRLPERLEALGWDTDTLWAIDVFADPESVADRLADRLGLPLEDPEDVDGDDGEDAR